MDGAVKALLLEIAALKAELAELKKAHAKEILTWKQTELSLREKADLYDTFVNVSPDTIVVTDLTGTILFSSKNAQSMFGFEDQAEAYGTSVLQYIDPAEHGKVLESLHLRLSGKAIPPQEYTGLKKGGITFFIEINGEIIRDEQGKPEKLLYIIRDISKRKKAEAELQKSESRFHSTLENMIEGCQIIGFDWKYLFVNNAAARHARTPADKLLNHTMYEMFPGIGHTEVYKKLATCMHERIVQNFENEFIYPDGSNAWFDLRVQPTSEGIFILTIDITERKAYEQKVHELNAYLEQEIKETTQAKEKAEESDRLKSAFLANMSHEIRTPLNAILGFTQILTVQDDIPQKKREEYLSIIDQNSESLQQIISDVLDISKLETHQLVIAKRRFEVSSVLGELDTVFRNKIINLGKDHVRLSLRQPEEAVWLTTDKIRLIQIFTNLLNNAVKFTSQGEIVFGFDGIYDRKIGFFVKDTGIGIKPEHRSAVFERFRQVDNSLTRLYGGAGLGLAIVKNLIDMMGGEIELESEAGKGTIFRFSFPLDENSAPPVYPHKL
ncbi:MAG: PAS domain S-box protein [Prolixibacteraceae bacterium]